MRHGGYGAQWAQEAEERRRAPGRDARLWGFILGIASAAYVTRLTDRLARTAQGSRDIPAYQGHNAERTGPVYFLCPAMLLRGNGFSFMSLTVRISV